MQIAMNCNKNLIDKLLCFVFTEKFYLSAVTYILLGFLGFHFIPLKFENKTNILTKNFLTPPHFLQSLPAVSFRL